MTNYFQVGQYFKKKREKVEILIESSTGLGLAFTRFPHHS